MSNFTPMIQQYLTIKAQYKDAFLFFRLGDFYEMFFDDAIKASKELEITLTSRDGGQERVPMCGVPYHASENYIKQLVSKGYKVAICEQVEDPKEAKGVVKREVVQLITPGTVMEGSMLDERENNFLAAISPLEQETYLLSYNDLTTGETWMMKYENGMEGIIHELFNLSVKEVVIPSTLSDEDKLFLEKRLGITLSVEDQIDLPEEYRYLVENLENEGYIQGFARLFQYIHRTQKRNLDHLQPVSWINQEQYMQIDMYSRRNLELVETLRKQGKKGSLLWVLDQTVTAMGARLLKKWLERPLLSLDEIESRHKKVQGFLEQMFQREALRDALSNVYDLERLAGRVSYGNVNARDLLQLKKSLGQVPMIMDLLQEFSETELKRLSYTMDPLSDLYALLDESLHEDPPLSIKEGGVMKDGYNQVLDDYRYAMKNGKKWIVELEQKERIATGIKSLKIGFNKVFGYYIEVTKSNIPNLPEGRYERKQTLANAERYITPELKEKESLILEAEEKSMGLEYDLFLELRQKVKEYIPQLQLLAEQISQLDVLQGFAVASERYQYIRPSFTNDRKVNISEGRHPVVEQVIESGEFVGNDTVMDNGTDIFLITGPNMSGKSTYMRQVALIAIMAQIGCFVPCKSAELPIFDQIFTRIGAADDLVAGQSTFMVEMLEAKNALTNATENSLILLDEIGRGTSTYDGMALAQAIIEYIHEHVHAKTLFSTHYHELTDLEQQLSKLKNVHVRAEEYEGRVVFLHKLFDGAADESYGIHVAKLAQLPELLIDRAHTLLHQWEKASLRSTSKETNNREEQLELFEEATTKKSNSGKEHPVVKELKKLNLLDMTPLDAINKLYELQKKLK
ncbi:DNA mismatch repair protein MutS [Bacillaceae bacterium S4-13-56]